MRNKWISRILILLICLLLCGCGMKQTESAVAEDVQTEEEQKEPIEAEPDDKTEDAGNEKEKEPEPPKYICVGMIRFDEANDIQEIYLHEYNKFGRREKTSSLSHRGYVYEQYYDKNENIVEQHSYDKDGELSYKYLTEYDEYGNCIRNTEEVSGSFYYTYDNMYGRFGKLEECIITDETGEKPTEKIVYEYDALGNKKSQKTYDLESDTITAWEEYDRKGNRLKLIYYEDGQVQRQYTYEYDEHDNVKTREMFKTGTGTKTHIYENEYDENGNLLKVSEYDDSNTLVETKQYVYLEAKRFKNLESYKEVLELAGITDYDMPLDSPEASEMEKATMVITWEKLPEGRTEEVELGVELGGKLDNSTTILPVEEDGTIYDSTYKEIGQLTNGEGLIVIELYETDAKYDIHIYNNDNPENRDYLIYNGNMDERMGVCITLESSEDSNQILLQQDLETCLNREDTGIWTYMFYIDHGILKCPNEMK